MAGFLFYWLAWSWWIYLTFIMNKNNRFRLPVSAAILISIILSTHFVSLGSYDVSLAAFFLLGISYYYFLHYRFWPLLYISIRIIIVTLFGASFFLLALYDPVWLILEKHWVFGLLFTLLSLVLFKNYAERIFSSLIGLIQADILYALVLSKSGIQYPILSGSFLDGLALQLSILTLWYGLESLQIISQQNFSEGKEKQL